MVALQVENLVKTFHDRIILNNVSFSVDEGEKVALVAQNGTGKSTLLKILLGKESYDSGTVAFQKAIKVAYLEQDPSINLNKTIKEEIFSSDSVKMQAVRLYEESLADPTNIVKMQEAHDVMTKNNAWEYEEQIAEILRKLKLDTLTEKISTFSGGQIKRVALALCLIDNPDFLIMDEPTNHLDVEMIDWLENYLIDKNIALLLVTHDRYFLERICSRIIELEDGSMYKYKGNYSYYLEKKASRVENENIGIDKTRALLKKELQYVRRGPQGRQSKSGARVDAYYKMKEGLKEKKIVEKVKLDVVSERLGSKVLEIHNLTKSFGSKKILNKFTYSFTKGEKIGIIGNNGVGKTTFLNLIMGLTPFDSGKIVTGDTVKFGYYTQSQDELNPNDKVIDCIKNIANFVKLSDGTELSASNMLERFLFPPKRQQTIVSKLSGGEKKRISLLKVLMLNPNFLILDEPTNDFDLMTLSVLEEFLLHFKGCLLVISHDRYFMDKIVDHLFIFKGNGEISDFPGNYSQYRETLDREEQQVETTATVQHAAKPKTNNDKESRELYKEISKLEKRKETLTAKVIALGQNYLEIANVGKELKELQIEIDDKTERWLEMSV